MPATKTAATRTVTFCPAPSLARHETQPVLPTEVVVHEGGEVVASYADHEDVTYKSFAAFEASHQVSASELLAARLVCGPTAGGLDDDRIRALRDEAGAAGDHETVERCRSALAGDELDLDAVAEQILEAMLATLD